jgi:hypothetical protein
MKKIIGYVKLYNKNKKLPIYDNTEYSKLNINSYNRNGLFFGRKYECVEFARRFYIYEFNTTFPSIDNAIDIFNIKNGIDIRNNSPVPFLNIENDGKYIPDYGDMLIWYPIDDFETTGHVAIVLQVNINEKYIKIAEQNGNSKTGIRKINYFNRKIYESNRKGYICGFVRIKQFNL